MGKSPLFKIVLILMYDSIGRKIHQVKVHNFKLNDFPYSRLTKKIAVQYVLTFEMIFVSGRESFH